MFNHLVSLVVLLVHIELDELAGGRIQAADVWLLTSLFLSKNLAHSHSEHLSKLNTPLVKTVNVVDKTFHGYTVLINCKKLSTVSCAERPTEKNTQTRPVPCEKLVLKESIRHAIRFKLVDGPAERKGVRLCKEVRHELVVAAYWLAFRLPRTLGLSKADEFSRDGATLVHELVERMLTIGSWFAEYNWASVGLEAFTVYGYAFAVALHVKLLHVRWEAKQGLTIGENCPLGKATNISIIEAD